jgi:gluconate 5-dehydrogenase
VTQAPGHLSRFGLEGRTALVTGAARGLGYEIAKALAEAGATVWLNGRDAETLQARCRDLAGQNLDVRLAAFDATDTNAAETWVTASDPAPDILVNNVGLRHRYGTVDLPADDFRRVVEANLTSAYTLARAVIVRLKRDGRTGAIINVTSIAGQRARPGDPAYTAGKGGLEALTRSLAVEFGKDGFRCNAIAPGYFATEANAQWLEDPDVIRFVEARVPAKRWARPDEIGGAAVFLASDAASYVNGHVLVVDAGMSINY